ncbi:MAG: cytochrome b N-terminal domain-containing protein [Candidatus Latescibacterota bacterium]|nr:MAG: cytochrome b N-terminal domain-containing protein [Candidatus Latescibacterota bacterium]
MNGTGLDVFWTNLKQVPTSFRDSLVRQGAPTSDRARAQAVFSNVFLHLHSTRSHVRTLRFSTTLAMGMATLSFFLILVVTGVLLMVYYKPSVDLAYESMKDIHFVVPTGRVIRNVHRWAAHLMVITVFLHMARVFYTGSYRKPREFNWLMGMGLFVLTLALSFTGYLLPWDQLAYWAVTIGANIAGSPAELTDALGITGWFDPGGFQKRLLLGASEVGEEALIRFYLLHVMVLPLFVLALLAVHFWRIRKDGGLGRPGGTPTVAGKGAAAIDADAAGAGAASASPGEVDVAHTPSEAGAKTFGLMAVIRDRTPATNLDPEDTVPSWPYLLRAELFIFMACVLLSLLLGVFFDAPLKEAANPSIPENPAKAPWYFLGLQEMVSYSAFMGGLVIPAIVVLGLALIPYLDREPGEAGTYFDNATGRRVAWRSLLFGAVAAILTVAIPVNFGWLRSWFPGVPQLVIIFINPGTLLTAAYALWSIHVLRREGSTRMAAIALFTCFLIGFVILSYVGSELRGPNWDFYWSKSQWPVH